MYLPDHFRETSEDEIARLISSFPLATVVAHAGGGLLANHIPLLAAPGGALIGHVARANDMHRLLPDGHPVLAIFQGGDAYVSPNDYPTKPEHHRHVPTWNYQVVHVHGTIAFQHDTPSKRRAVALLTRDHERRANGAKAWKTADAPADYMEAMLDGIVAFRIEMTRRLAKSKLSQNREARDRAGAISGLRERGKEPLARAMEERGRRA